MKATIRKLKFAIRDPQFAVLPLGMALCFLGAKPSAFVAASVANNLIVSAVTKDGERPGAALPSGFIETQISGLSEPTAMAINADGRIFVCQQTGALRVIKNGVLLPAPFLSVTVDSSGERGLLGVAFDPNFEVNHWVYVYYTVPAPVHNRVSRFTASVTNPDVAAAGSETILLELNNLSATNHNGGALHFGPDGKLYIATGENAISSNSQSLSNVLGKILRLNPDPNNLIPSDNPFFATASGNNRSIWALGLRNPFTFTFQPGTGRMHINDVGQSAWEEVNVGSAGSNFGWPNCEGTCNSTGVTNPLYQYANDAATCAITGGAFYNPTSTNFPAEYVGKYFLADFCAGWIKYFDPQNAPSAGAASTFANGIAAPVDLQVANDGSLYYLARGSNSLFRVLYNDNTTPRFQFTADTYSVAESTRSVAITVRRLGNPLSTVSVDFATDDNLSFIECGFINGVADQRCDYLLTSGTLAFAPNDLEKSFSVMLFDDQYQEGDETFSVSLSNPAGGAQLGNITTATVRLTDNDSATVTNPIDDARYFVRQHYADFLQRLPDAAGEDFWTDQIEQCASTDAQCIANRRIAVSASFFFSVEFSESGGYVYQLYTAAFGDQQSYRPSYEQFLPDRARVIGDSTLEQGKLELANIFAQRVEFTSRYPLNLTAADFVDAILATVQQGSGLTFTAQERQQFIDNVNTGGRGVMLKNLGDNAALKQALFNRSFVLMQYFGYLRRDPEQEGYDFWLRILDAQSENISGMVCAFITSQEYQQRFNTVFTRTNDSCS
ncbi:MAG TPA: PQQ-dependent sugar dehydrogenase [Pyrinomonadaceae bacterium]|nr:PQQ-dependent sugar dehydrogenase [Pyrinomonadaceae bacterium]